MDPKSKKTRRVTKYVKKSFDVKPCDLIIELQDELETFLRYKRNIVRQHMCVHCTECNKKT